MLAWNFAGANARWLVWDPLTIDSAGVDL